MILRFAICLLALLVLLVLDMPKHCLLVIEGALLVEAGLVVFRLLREQRASKGERGGRARVPLLVPVACFAVLVRPQPEVSSIDADDWESLVEAVEDARWPR